MTSEVYLLGVSGVCFWFGTLFSSDSHKPVVRTYNRKESFPKRLVGGVGGGLLQEVNGNSGVWGGLFLETEGNVGHGGILFFGLFYINFLLIATL